MFCSLLFVCLFFAYNTEEFGIQSKEIVFVTYTGSSAQLKKKPTCCLKQLKNNKLLHFSTINLFLSPLKRLLFQKCQSTDCLSLSPTLLNVCWLFLEFHNTKGTGQITEASRDEVEYWTCSKSVRDAPCSGRLREALFHQNKLCYVSNIDLDILEDIIHLLNPLDEANRHLSTHQTPTLYLVPPDQGSPTHNTVLI